MLSCVSPPGDATVFKVPAGCRCRYFTVERIVFWRQFDGYIIRRRPLVRHKCAVASCARVIAKSVAYRLQFLTDFVYEFSHYAECLKIRRRSSVSNGRSTVASGRPAAVETTSRSRSRKAFNQEVRMYYGQELGAHTTSQ